MLSEVEDLKSVEVYTRWLFRDDPWWNDGDCHMSSNRDQEAKIVPVRGGHLHELRMNDRFLHAPLQVIDIVARRENHRRPVYREQYLRVQLRGGHLWTICPRVDSTNRNFP